MEQEAQAYLIYKEHIGQLHMVTDSKSPLPQGYGAGGPSLLNIQRTHWTTSYGHGQQVTTDPE